MGDRLDRELALSRVGGDVDLLKEIAILFVQDYPRVLLELHQAIACGDAQAVERTAHGLKGSVSKFGAQAAMEAARTLENLGRARELEELHRCSTVLNWRSRHCVLNSKIFS